MEKLRPGRVGQPGLVVGSLGGSGVEAGGAGGWAPCPQTTSAPLGLWGAKGQAGGAGALTTQLQGPPTPWWSSHSRLDRLPAKSGVIRSRGKEPFLILSPVPPGWAARGTDPSSGPGVVPSFLPRAVLSAPGDTTLHCPPGGKWGAGVPTCPSTCLRAQVTPA